ncbi:MAG TPA: RNA 2',3'-cyclic phosphodiesterase [Thermoplasmata archaeon]|nr:RNA 2',3'-cyclic phosphodiesterase [Thermoplasmata archaeon]
MAVDVPEIDPVSGFPEPSAHAPRHFTIRFLGEVDDPTVGAIDGALREAAAGLESFRLTLSGIGAFPDWKRPRIVYVAAAVGRAQLVEVAGTVDRALATIGIPRDPRPFVPHVTLRRIRTASEARAAQRASDAAGDRAIADMRVGELLLKASELAPTGAIHRVLGRYPLGPHRDPRSGRPAATGTGGSVEQPAPP